MKFELRMAAIRVYLRSEKPAHQSARHSASRALALLVVSLLAARWTDEERTAIQLTAPETWNECKRRCRAVKSAECRVITRDSGYAHPWSWRPSGK